MLYIFQGMGLRFYQVSFGEESILGIPTKAKILNVQLIFHLRRTLSILDQ